MNRNLIRVGLVSLFVAVAGVFSVQAQMSHSYRAEIPFDFSANGAEFKAGSYSVGLLRVGSNSGPVMIQSRDGKQSRFVANSAGGARSKADEGRLIFVMVGGSYVLKEVVTPTFGTKIRIRSTDAESLAIAKARTATVPIAKK